MKVQDGKFANGVGWGKNMKMLKPARNKKGLTFVEMLVF